MIYSMIEMTNWVLNDKLGLESSVFSYVHTYLFSCFRFCVCMLQYPVQYIQYNSVLYLGERGLCFCSYSCVCIYFPSKPF